MLTYYYVLKKGKAAIVDQFFLGEFVFFGALDLEYDDDFGTYQFQYNLKWILTMTIKYVQDYVLFYPIIVIHVISRLYTIYKSYRNGIDTSNYPTLSHLPVFINGCYPRIVPFMLDTGANSITVGRRALPSIPSRVYAR